MRDGVPLPSSTFMRQSVWVVVLVSLVGGAVYLLGRLVGVWLLLFAAVLFASGLRHAAKRLHPHVRIPVGGVVLLLSLLATLVIAGIFWFAGANLAGQLADLGDRIPRALDSVQSWLAGQPALRPVARELDALRSGADSSVGAGRFLEAFRVTLDTLSQLLIIAVLAVYIAFDGRRYTKGIVRLTPPAARDRVRDLLDALGPALSWWLAGRLLSMTVVGILTWIGLMVAGVPLPATLGLLAGLLSFVPFLGPIAAAIPAGLVALTDSMQAVIWVAVVFSAVQLLESYLITPQIQERTVSVPPVVLVASQLVMGGLLGLGGVILATPLVVVLAVSIQLLYLEDILGEDVGVWGAHDG